MKKTYIKVAAMAVMMCAVLVSAHAQTDISANIPEIAMVYVEGGTFVMGCTSKQNNCYDDAMPMHNVTLSSFNIGKYEVTQAQWQTVMGSNPSYFKDCPNCPVESVSWDDIQEFIKKLNSMTGKNYRLPTEAEWEYAARGGNKSMGYTYSGSNTAGEAAWYYENSGDKKLNDRDDRDTYLINVQESNCRTHIVGGKKANELGLYDMSGNVWEWCSDWYGSYSSSSQTNPTGPSKGSYRVLRGGGWAFKAPSCRVAPRYGDSPDYRSSIIGFRLVLP